MSWKWFRFRLNGGNGYDQPWHVLARNLDEAFRLARWETTQIYGYRYMIIVYTGKV